MSDENFSDKSITEQSEADVKKRRTLYPPFNLRYIVLAAIAAMLAILAAVYLDIMQSLLVLAVCVGLLLLYNIIYKRHWAAVAVFAIIAVAFYMYADAGVKNADSKILYEGNVKGVVESTNINDDGTTVIITSEINGKNEKISVYLNNGGNDIVCGDVISANMTLEPLQRKANEYSYDNRLQMLGLRVTYTAYVDFDDVVILPREWNIMSPFWYARNSMISSLQEILPQKDSAFVAAMLFGADDLLPDESAQMFRDAGIAHVFSVSGMHISIIVFAINELLIKMFINRKARWLIISFILVLYCALTSFSPSILRASVMSSVMLMGGAYFRAYEPMNSLGIAALVLLLINPFYLFNLGFQLSFMASLGIVCVSNVVDSDVAAVRIIISSVLVTIVAQLACLPLMVNSFGNISVISVLANILIVPIVSGALVTALGLCIICLIIPDLSFVLYLLRPLTWIIFNMTQLLSSIDFASVDVLPMGGIMVLGYYTLFMTISKFYAVRWKTKLITCLLIIALLAGSVMYINNERANTVSIDFLSVGNGDCAIINIGDAIYVVDAGSSDYNNIGASNKGYRELKNYLRGAGITNVNVILTHGDQDHVGGMITLLENDEIIVDKLIYNYNTCADNTSLSAAMLKCNDVTSVVNGDVINERDATFYFIYPMYDTDYINNTSLAFVFEYSGCRILFCGDNETTDGNIIANEDVNCDIMVMPHHGKASAYCAELIAAASPSHQIISSNDIYATAGNVHNTAEAGQITVTIDKDGKYVIKEYMRRDQK